MVTELVVHGLQQGGSASIPRSTIADVGADPEPHRGSRCCRRPGGSGSRLRCPCRSRTLFRGAVIVGELKRHRFSAEVRGGERATPIKRKKHGVARSRNDDARVSTVASRQNRPAQRRQRQGNVTDPNGSIAKLLLVIEYVRKEAVLPVISALVRKQQCLFPVVIAHVCSMAEYDATRSGGLEPLQQLGALPIVRERLLRRKRDVVEGALFAKRFRKRKASVCSPGIRIGNRRLPWAQSRPMR